MLPRSVFKAGNKKFTFTADPVELGWQAGKKLKQAYNSYMGKKPKGYPKTGFLAPNVGGKVAVRTKVNKKRKYRKTGKINLYKEIKKIKKTNAIQRNEEICTHTEKIVSGARLTCNANEYGNGQYAICSQAEIEAALANVKKLNDSGTIVSGAILDGATQVKIHGTAKFYFKNNDNFPVNLWFYDMEAANDHSTNVQTAMQDYYTSVGTGNTNTTTYVADLRWTVMESREMKNFWKCVKLQKVHLNPGDEFTTYVKATGTYRPFNFDVESFAYYKGLSHIAYVRIFGVPCHDGTTLTNVGLTPCSQLDIIEWANIKIVFHGLGNTQTRVGAGNSVDASNLGTITSARINGIDVTEET